jgi:hypothetical protein
MGLRIDKKAETIIREKPVHSSSATPKSTALQVSKKLIDRFFRPGNPYASPCKRPLGRRRWKDSTR